MSIANQISLSLDVLMQNIARLQEQAATMPTTDEIKTTEGSTKEIAQADYVAALRSYAEQIGQKTELVQLYVRQNAEALQKASEALLETDGNTSLEARQAAAYLNAATAPESADVPGDASAKKSARTW